jgi:hypothetical protein
VGAVGSVVLRVETLGVFAVALARVVKGRGSLCGVAVARIEVMVLVVVDLGFEAEIVDLPLSTFTNESLGQHKGRQGRHNSVRKRHEQKTCRAHPHSTLPSGRSELLQIGAKSVLRAQ